jgi:uncharacterized membrane protein HdeD (DUF308 family)
MKLIMITFLIIYCAIASAIASGKIAQEKGRQIDKWMFAGLFLGIFGVLMAIGVPKLDKKIEVQTEETQEEVAG